MQGKRKRSEEKERFERLPKGFRGLWARITGKYQKIKAQNEREVKNCKTRERDERQTLIDRQLIQRQELQDRCALFFANIKNSLFNLKKDVAEYMEMGGPLEKRKKNHWLISLHIEVAPVF